MLVKTTPGLVEIVDKRSDVFDRNRGKVVDNVDKIILDDVIEMDEPGKS